VEFGSNLFIARGREQAILDGKMKQRIGSKMLRALKAGGIVLWYNYFVSKPTNPDVKGKD